MTLTFWVYNLVYWVPIILPLTPAMDYRTGTLAFFIIIVIRAIANVYRTNFLTLERAEWFPLRIPG